jgi:AsmA protein
MKVLKFVLLSVGGVVMLAVVAVILVVAVFDPNKYKSELSRAVKDKTGRTLAIEGKIGLSFFPSIGVAVGKTSVSEPNSSRIFARIDEARISLALLPLLSKQVVIDRVTLSGLAVDLVQTQAGKSNFADLAGEAAGPPPPPSASQPGRTPQRESMHLDIAGVEVRASTIGWYDEASGSRFKASITELKTGRIASGAPGKLSLSARVEASQPRADLQIKLAGSYRLDFEKHSFVLSGIDLKISDGAPGSTAPPISLAGDVEFNSSPQAIRFNLSADQLNLDRYLPASGKSGASAPAKAPAGVGTPAPGTPVGSQAEKPIDLSALKGLNLKGSLKIGHLVASNVKLEKVNLAVQATGGRIEINPLVATLYEGSLAGNANADANTNRFALKAQLGGVAVGPLLRDALNNDLLEGRGNVALDVQTGGATVGALKKALSGNANLALRDSALKGVNLDELLRKAKSLRGSSPASEAAAGRGERTDFTELGASFVIKNGIARNDDLSAKSPLLRLAGSGDIDIGANSIDYLLKVSVVASSGGQGGKDLGDLRGVTVPVKITGPLDAPRFRADLAATVGDAAKERVEEKLKERLQDRVKGLLRR